MGNSSSIQNMGLEWPFSTHSCLLQSNKKYIFWQFQTAAFRHNTCAYQPWMLIINSYQKSEIKKTTFEVVFLFEISTIGKSGKFKDKCLEHIFQICDKKNFDKTAMLHFLLLSSIVIWMSLPALLRMPGNQYLIALC